MQKAKAGMTNRRSGPRGRLPGAPTRGAPYARHTFRITPGTSNKNPERFPVRAHVPSFNFVNQLNRGASSSPLSSRRNRVTANRPLGVRISCGAPEGIRTSDASGEPYSNRCVSGPQALVLEALVDAGDELGVAVEQ